MANAAYKENEYRIGSTYGSLAYDFEQVLDFPEYGSQGQENYGVGTQTNIGAKPQAAPRTRQSIAPTAIIGFLIAAALVMVSMVARIQLLEVSNASAKLNSQLTELKEEQTRLKIEYESTFNLNEIEAYAINTLGMQKPVAEQIVYIDTAAQDKAVVIQQDSSRSIISRGWEFITSIGSYLTMSKE